MPQPAIDAATFAEIKTLMGDTFNDVIRLTMESLPEQLNLLEQAIKTKNAQQIFSVAHRIKSSSGTIGALGLAKDTEQIELIGRSGSADIPSALLQALDSSIREVMHYLENELK